MRILICDDEKQYVNAIHAAVYRWINQHPSYVTQMDEYYSSEDMLEAINNKTIYDIAFLDIHFPGELNGLQLAQVLREQNEHIAIVFISNYEEFVVDGYKVNALRFFYKPISDAQIFECLDITYRQLCMLVDAYVLVETSQQLCRIAHRSILYVESRAHYLYIHTINNVSNGFCARRKISQMIQDLPSEMFVQSHRSFIVNILFVQKIVRNEITLTDETKIPLSPRYKEHVIRSFKKFFNGDGL